jgi:hypothetical protein
MTTIAANVAEGAMVSDSRLAIEGVCWLPCTKIYRFDDELVGIAGNTVDENKWLAWRRNGKGRFPKLSDEFNGLSLCREGLFLLDEKGGRTPIERGFHAIGSGGNIAIAAMMLGQTAYQAVGLAKEIDLNTSGDVKVEIL